MFGWSRGGGIPASLQQYTYDLYVDSNAAAGGDGSVFAPFDDIADAITAVNSAGNGTKLGVVRGSHFRKQLAFTSTLTGIQVRAVGEGERPIFDGSRIISAGAITPHASYANVYQVNVTHETETAPSGGANGSNTFHIALYEDETLLTEQFASGTIDTNVQSVRDNPGSYTAHKVGSTTADPRTDTGGTQYTYYFHLTDSGDPTSNGAVMAYVEQAHVAFFGNNHVWSGLEFRRAANKDMTGMANGSYAGGGSITDCVFRDPGCHGCVLRPSLFSGNYFYGRQDGRSILVGGAGCNMFFNHGDGVYTPKITLTNNYIEDFSLGFYSHGNIYDGPVHEAIEARNNEATGCNTAWFVDRAKDAMLVDRLTITNCVRGLQTPEPDYAVAEFRNVSYLSPSSGDATGIVMNTPAIVRNSSFVFVNDGDKSLFANEWAQAEDSADVFDLELYNVSSKGGKKPNNARRRQVNLIVEDSVLGDLATVTGDSSVTSIVGENSYLSFAQRTIADMVTAGATLTDCLSPWQIETIEVVPGEADIRQTDTTRTATEVDAPSTSITANFSSWPVDSAIRVLDYDGGGSNFDTFLLESLAPSTSNGGYVTAHTTPANFSAKATRYSTYNKAIDFGAPIRDYHATRTADGPSFVVDYGTGTNEGQQGTSLWRITTLTGRTAVAYDIASGSFPQIVSATGVIDAAFYCRVGDTISVTACVNREGDDVVWAGDPDSTGVAILDPSSPLYALGMGRQAA